MKTEDQPPFTSPLTSWIRYVACSLPFQAKLSSEKNIFSRIQKKYSDWKSTFRKRIFSTSKKENITCCLSQAKKLIQSCVQRFLRSNTMYQMKEIAQGVMNSHAWVSLVELFKKLISPFTRCSRPLVVVASLLFSLKLSFFIISALQHAIWFTVSAVSLCAVFFIISVLVCLSLQNFLKGLKDKKYLSQEEVLLKEELIHWSKVDLDSFNDSDQFKITVPEAFPSLELLQEKDEGPSHSIEVLINSQEGSIEIRGPSVNFMLQNGGWRVCQQTMSVLKENGGFHLGGVMSSIHSMILSESQTILLLVDPAELKEADQDLLRQTLQDVFSTWTNNETGRRSFSFLHLNSPFPF